MNIGEFMQAMAIFSLCIMVAMSVPMFIMYIEYLYKKQDEEDDVDI